MIHDNNLPKTALVTGVASQDGFCLAEFLQEKGCETSALLKAHGHVVSVEN